MNMSFLTSNKPLNIIIWTLALTACNARVIEPRQTAPVSYSLMGQQTSQAADAPLINYGVPRSSAYDIKENDAPIMDLTF
jgi:hypothetical protein